MLLRVAGAATDSPSNFFEGMICINFEYRRSSALHTEPAD